MEFAGNKFIYLSKLKKGKIKKIRQSEEDNKEDAPSVLPKKEFKMEIEEKEPKDSKKEKNNNQIKKNDSEDSPDSDDAIMEVNSNNFNINLNNSLSLQNNLFQNQQAAPGIQFKKSIDTNIFLIKGSSLEDNPQETLANVYKCSKCNSYLNKYSKLEKKDDETYDWTCEFCNNLNQKIKIDINSIPKNEIFENVIEPPMVDKKVNEDDYSLIFCFDISGSMCQSYSVDKKIRDKFNKIIGKTTGGNNQYLYNDNFNFKNFDFSQNNTNYMSRLDLVKMAVENNINSLLKNSPNVKVGIVSFGNEIEVKGDCLSNVMYIREKDMENESKLISLGKENGNLIKTPIKTSSKNIIKSLRETEENGATALGPAVLFSLSMLNNAKNGSRIFLCTDGLSNLGVGDISGDQEKAKEFYNKIGNMAKEKGVVISLITFSDSESEIAILKDMVELSGGEIIQVDPEHILDGFDDLLENNTIATDVEMKINLNRTIAFKDQEKQKLKNDKSSFIEKLGNVTKETEKYYEFKFKKAYKLAQMDEIDFDKLDNLTFQTEIIYKSRNGGKFLRIITKNLKVSDNKLEIEKQADMNIVSTFQIQKSANIAKKGNLVEAQAQIHVARNYLNYNLNNNPNSLNKHIYHQFNNNMNSFHENLNQMNQMNFNNPMMNNNMTNNPMMNNNMMNNNMINNNMMMNNNQNNNQFNMNINMNNMNNNMYNNMNNINQGGDRLFQQMYSLSNTSQNRQNMMFNRYFREKK